MNEFLSIGIVGVVLSLCLEYAQRKWGLDSVEARVAAIVFSAMIGSVYWFVSQNVEIYQAVVGVLASASTVYAVFFSGKKTSSEPAPYYD